MKDYYVIKVVTGERSFAEPAYIGTDFKEVESHIMEFADWYCSDGTCRIEKVNEHFRALERWDYKGGVLMEHKIKRDPNSDRTWETVYSGYKKPKDWFDED